MRRSWLRDSFFRISKKDEERVEREKAFAENGSKLLEKLIASSNGKPIPIRSFSAQDLRQATNNYCEHQVWHWYKGSLEGRVVLVLRLTDKGDLPVNDLVICAKMSAHGNTLRPIGCCLETTPPIIVYEFAANGIPANQIYVSRRRQPMVWERRLQIARQIAHTISYLHTAFQRPVIHMAIQTTNFLLDEHDAPKLSNFLVSVSIPEGETDVEAYEGLRNSRFSTPELEASGKAT